MNFPRQSVAAALLAACVAAASANTAFAAGQQAPSGAAAPGTAAPGAGMAHPADADASGGEDKERGRGPRQGFGGSRLGAPGLDGPSPHDHDMPPHGPHGGPGLFGQLQRLDLSETQQDKLFAITHAAAPQQRNQEKAERKAHETLRAMGGSPQFDDARANAAARELGQAIAGGVLLRARVESQVLAVLTPAQREQLRKERPPGPPERR